MSNKILELQDRTGETLGYYVADDEELTQDMNAAAVYDCEHTARIDVAICNKQWELERGQKFVAVPAPNSI